MRIAIVGTGISRLTCAWHGRYAVDTGFVVYNEQTYPNFVKILDRLGVETHPTQMSFSVKCERTGLEYSGRSLNTVFAQRRNLVRPWFHRLLRDILRFNRAAKRLLEQGVKAPDFATVLSTGGYSPQFLSHYILPMGAAIWSTSPARLLRFPAYFFLRFFRNHGLLGVNEHLQWRTLVGGSSTYVKPMADPFRDRIRVACPVTSVTRGEDGVTVTSAGAGTERFDHVILATHSDQALAVLADPTDAEREVLGAIGYADNDVVLHTDTSLLPRNRRAWACWNYHVLPEDRDQVVTTYNMNELQGIEGPDTFCVTLNRSSEIDPERVIRSFRMAHPVYTPETVAAQARHGDISGTGRTHFCGAYWRNGFHEDGVVSALEVCRRFEARL